PQGPGAQPDPLRRHLPAGRCARRRRQGGRGSALVGKGARDGQPVPRRRHGPHGARAALPTTLTPRTNARRVPSGRGFLEILGFTALAVQLVQSPAAAPAMSDADTTPKRSEEHTSELQSRGHLVCRLLLEKKKQRQINTPT